MLYREVIEKDQTFYSFRHTGAINVFEKTGSLLKLQQVSGRNTNGWDKWKTKDGKSLDEVERK